METIRATLRAFRKLWAGILRLLRMARETVATVWAALCLLFHGWRVTRNWKAHKRNLEALQRATLRVKRGKILGRPVEVLTETESEAGQSQDSSE